MNTRVKAHDKPYEKFSIKFYVIRDERVIA